MSDQPPASWVPNAVQRRNADWRTSIAKHSEGTAHSIASYKHDVENPECSPEFDILHASADAASPRCFWCQQPIHVVKRKVMKVINGMWQDMDALAAHSSLDKPSILPEDNHHA